MLDGEMSYVHAKDLGSDALSKEIYAAFKMTKLRAVSMAMKLATQGGFLFNDVKGFGRERDYSLIDWGTCRDGSATF